MRDKSFRTLALSILMRRELEKAISKTYADRPQALVCTNPTCSLASSHERLPWTYDLPSFNAAQRRDEANNDPRKTEIPIEIRSIEEKLDNLRRVIEDDQQVLRDLRHCSDAQNEIVVLNDQTTKDVENLRDAMREHSFDFQKYVIQTPDPVRIAEDDVNGDLLVDAMEKLATQVSKKFDEVSDKLSTTTNDVAAKQQIVSQKSAMLSHNRQSFESLSAKLASMNGENGCYGKYLRIVRTVKRFEMENGVATTIDDTDPQRAVNHITAQLEKLDENSVEGLTGDILYKVFKQIKKMVRTRSSRFLHHVRL